MTTEHTTEEQDTLARAREVLDKARVTEDPVMFNRLIAEAMKLLTTSRIPEINSYHFSMGNSRDGVVGMACRVMASSKEKATQRLQRLLADAIGSDYEIAIRHDDLQQSEYICVYFTPENLHDAYIDAVDPVG